MNLGFQACMVLQFKQFKLSRVAEYVRKDKEMVSATVCKIISPQRANCVGIYSVICACQLLGFHFTVMLNSLFEEWKWNKTT